MSNDIKSESQAAPAAQGRTPPQLGASPRTNAPLLPNVTPGPKVRNGVNVAQVFRPEAFDLSDRASVPPSPAQAVPRARQNAGPTVTKCKWSRPLLTGTDPQTEFNVTYSKQRTEKFLTGTRIDISDFRKLPNSRPVFSRKKSSKSLRRARAKPAVIGPVFPGSLKAFLPNILARTSAFLPGSDQNIECDVTSRKQRTENFLP